MRATHILDDPAERIVIQMPRKPAGIGIFAYLLAVKLVYMDMTFTVVGIVRHSGRNDMTPLEFLNSLVMNLKEMYGNEPRYTPNVVMDSAFCIGRHELTNVSGPDGAKLLRITASVRNDSDKFVRVLKACSDNHG